MRNAHAVHEEVSVHVPASGWPEIAAATTDGSALAVDSGPERRKAGWPEAAAFTTDGWVSVDFDDLRR